MSSLILHERERGRENTRLRKMTEISNTNLIRYDNKKEKEKWNMADIDSLVQFLIVDMIMDKYMRPDCELKKIFCEYVNDGT